MEKKDKKKMCAILGTILFLIIGTGCFILGAYLSGWNVLEWFYSPQALLIYALLSIGGLLGFGMYLKWKFLRGDD